MFFQQVEVEVANISKCVKKLFLTCVGQLTSMATAEAGRGDRQVHVEWDRSQRKSRGVECLQGLRSPKGLPRNSILLKPFAYPC